MRGMVVDAKAKGLQVLLALFGPYGKDQHDRRCRRPSRQQVREYNSLLDALAVEQSRQPRVRRRRNMGPDGLHPTQTGYDEMADAISRKLLDDVPALRPPGGACP